MFHVLQQKTHNKHESSNKQIKSTHNRSTCNSTMTASDGGKANSTNMASSTTAPSYSQQRDKWSKDAAKSITLPPVSPTNGKKVKCSRSTNTGVQQSLKDLSHHLLTSKLLHKLPKHTLTFHSLMINSSHWKPVLLPATVIQSPCKKWKNWLTITSYSTSHHHQIIALTILMMEMMTMLNLLPPLSIDASWNQLKMWL